MQQEEALIARICHDLITPFNAINLGIETYEESKDISLLEDIKTSVEKANSLLKFMRELYSIKYEVFFYSVISLNKLISDLLKNYNIKCDLESDIENISRTIGKIVMYNAIIAREIMPFGGNVVAKINNTSKEITTICSGNKLLEIDINASNEPDHKNIIRHNLAKFLEKIGAQATITKQESNVIILERL
ncbi:MAG: hypothetical protein LBS23_00405 [Holosporaceae bacterium]|jgi:hypothetical protein|nr:hypothetical protein [Holosporaceae bacterium]